MKTLYILFVVLTDTNGYESMRAVSGTEHKDKIHCIAEKANYDHNAIEGRISYFCGDSKLYFNKENKLH